MPDFLSTLSRVSHFNIWFFMEIWREPRPEKNPKSVTSAPFGGMVESTSDGTVWSSAKGNSVLRKVTHIFFPACCCVSVQSTLYISQLFYIFVFFFTGWTLPVNSIFTFLPVSYENISTCTVWLCLFICFHLFILPAHPSPQQWVKNNRFCQLKLIDAGLKIQIPERFCSKRSPDRVKKPC